MRVIAASLLSVSQEQKLERGWHCNRTNEALHSYKDRQDNLDAGGGRDKKWLGARLRVRVIDYARHGICQRH